MLCPASLPGWCWVLPRPWASLVQPLHLWPIFRGRHKRFLWRFSPLCNLRALNNWFGHWLAFLWAYRLWRWWFLKRWSSGFQRARTKGLCRVFEVNITAARGDFPIDACIDLPVGLSVLVGTSGAGKSSLLRLIAGLDCPRQGRITFDGDIWFDSEKKINRPTYQRRIGMVFQTGLLLVHKTVMQNIELGA
ncbi:MAG TPA: ATP-binding cassette domain-containing protein, partial [Devosia sp.]|nr:ATP-binding cassette domain-containing protein [Devosia sp.]